MIAADLDDDGKLDLFVANDGSANFFFHNLGGMNFEEVAARRGVSANAEGGFQAGMGVARGDLDGDGRLDIVVTNFFNEGASFFQSLGGGHYADRSSAIGLLGYTKSLLGFGVNFGDLDNDGRLDILSANGHVSDFGGIPYRMPMQLLLGQGSGMLRDVTRQAGEALVKPRLGRALAAADFDHDGRLDAAVSAINSPLVLLQNVSKAQGGFVVLELEGTKSNRDAIGARVHVVQGEQVRMFERYGGGSFQAAEDLRLHIGLGSREDRSARDRLALGNEARLSRCRGESRIPHRRGNAKVD